MVEIRPTRVVMCFILLIFLISCEIAMFESTSVFGMASFVTIFAVKPHSPTIVNCMTFSVAMFATFVLEFVGWVVVATLKSGSDGKVLHWFLYHLSLCLFLNN